MRGFRHVRFSFVAIFTLCFVVAMSSCSKKDVVSDEPVINPSDTSGEAVGSSGAADSTGVPTPQTGSAGDVGAESGDLQTAYFAFDSFNLGSEARSALKSNGNWLKQNKSATVQIEGHCDEKGTTEYNLALGEKRANAARDYLVRMGIDKSRLSVISYGKERPADPGHNDAAWAKNRRASFVILSR